MRATEFAGGVRKEPGGAWDTRGPSDTRGFDKLARRQGVVVARKLAGQGRVGGRAYLVYAPSGGPFTVDLTADAGNADVGRLEWFQYAPDTDRRTRVRQEARDRLPRLFGGNGRGSVWWTPLAQLESRGVGGHHREALLSADAAKETHGMIPQQAAECLGLRR